MQAAVVRGRIELLLTAHNGQPSRKQGDGATSKARHALAAAEAQMPPNKGGSGKPGKATKAGRGLMPLSE